MEKRMTMRDFQKTVHKDFSDLKKHYPFSYWIEGTEDPIIRVVAANKLKIKEINALEEDFLGQYSKNLLVIIHKDYKENGCIVYGGKWIDTKKIHPNDIHFYPETFFPTLGYKLCVGVPESFRNMQNILLENVRTAENMLIAYESLMEGSCKELILNSYSHGNLGRAQYREKQFYGRKT